MSHYDDVRDIVEAEMSLEIMKSAYKSYVKSRDWAACDTVSEEIQRKERELKELKGINNV